MSSAVGNAVSGPAAAAAALAVDLLKLSKYRLSGLVAFTAGTGYVMRADRDCDGAVGPRFYREASAATAGTFLTAAAANTLNQMYEVSSDARMPRTRLRPLPTGRLSLAQASVFAAATAVSGIAVLLHETNETPAALAALNIALYAGVYTPLKAVHTINTWVGAVVGALPPMLGWAAASGGDLTSPRERGAWALGSMLFLWQIPHFHALALVSRADYTAGGLKMLAVSNPVANAAWARVTAAAMVPIGALFVSTDSTNKIFGWEAALLGAWMYRGATRMTESPTSMVAARSLFRASIFCLPVSLLLMMAHRTSPQERAAAHSAYLAIQREQFKRQHERDESSSVVMFHPWETLAPFPFLPLPLWVPAVVDAGVSARHRTPSSAASLSAEEMIHHNKNRNL
jgi:heme o synthase